MAGSKSKSPEVVYAGPLTMEDAREFKKIAREWGREAGKTKETARAKLRELGIIRADGRLTKNYSG